MSSFCSASAPSASSSGSPAFSNVASCRASATPAAHRTVRVAESAGRHTGPERRHLERIELRVRAGARTARALSPAGRRVASCRFDRVPGGECGHRCERKKLFWSQKMPFVQFMVSQLAVADAVAEVDERAERNPDQEHHPGDQREFRQQPDREGDTDQGTNGTQGTERAVQSNLRCAAAAQPRRSR